MINLALVLEDGIFKEVVESIIVNEVKSDTEMSKLGVRILADTISQSLDSLLSKSIVTNIEEFK
jgi:hypothetical protein